MGSEGGDRGDLEAQAQRDFWVQGCSSFNIAGHTCAHHINTFGSLQSDVKRGVSMYTLPLCVLPLLLQVTPSE